MDNPAQITVILCTYDRARSLAAALDSVAVQTFSKLVGWEILVVDNNSSDETLQVIEDFQRRYPGRIRYLFEPQQGISHARNSGVRNARGEILAFIDDDETAAPGWLENLTAKLYDGEWSGAGGRVLPSWNCSRPRWCSDHPFMLAPLAVFGAGTEAGELIEPPFGANMAFRKEVFEACGGFRTDLGRVGNGLLSGEDTEFGCRVLATGRRLRYEPLAFTYHPVDEIRVNKKYFLEWWFNKGRSDVRELRDQPRKTQLLGIPIRLLQGLVPQAVRWIVAVEPSHRFVCKLRVWVSAGQVVEYYHQSLDAKRKRTERNANVSPPTESGG